MYTSIIKPVNQTPRSLQEESHLYCLWSAVAAINNDVSTSGVGGRIRGQVQVSPLQLVGLSLATHGNLVPPDLLGLFRHEVGDLRGDIPGGNCVGAGEADPFNREGLA